ncbi:MAG: hypothetical protein JOY80_07005 [Candidatus Dormibacteraeota bacterium]|nr:hypothetical protein [Candidatus Dormibacteraeota bacterium]
MSDSLAAALATLRSRYGPEALRTGALPEAAGFWATGVPAIDGVLSGGGLPHGRVTLIATGSRRGPSGRLSLLQALTAIASRSRDVGYVDLAATLDPGYLADLGAALSSCLVLDPGTGRWERGLLMARSLVRAGLPWCAVALGAPQPRPSTWEQALVSLVEAVARRDAVCVIATPAPVAAPLAYASSLTLECAADDWQRAHGDVTGLRVRVATTKSKVHAPGGEATLLLRYPRPYTVAEVVGLPTVVVPRHSTAADTSFAAETAQAG